MSPQDPRNMQAAVVKEQTTITDTGLPLAPSGCVKVFADKKSGRDAQRPELKACLAYLRPGDTLVVPALDRLARSLQDLITLVSDLRRNGIGFRSPHEALDTTTPGGRLVFHVFAALAEFIREIGAPCAEGLRVHVQSVRTHAPPMCLRRAIPPAPRTPIWNGTPCLSTCVKR